MRVLRLDGPSLAFGHSHCEIGTDHFDYWMIRAESSFRVSEDCLEDPDAIIGLTGLPVCLD